MFRQGTVTRLGLLMAGGLALATVGALAPDTHSDRMLTAATASDAGVVIAADGTQDLHDQAQPTIHYTQDFWAAPYWQELVAH